MNYKIHADLVEIEDLVYQILFFSQKPEHTNHTKVMITNLSKKILEFLQIEYEDIEHLFKHEMEQHNYDVHTVGDKSVQIHETLIAQNEKIKKIVSNFPLLCQKLVSGDISEEDFKATVEKECSDLLKLVGSENHELEFMKEFLGNMQ